MLKIREYDDNGNKIDLKELEKFGFRYIYGTSWYNGKFRINKNTRKIRIITNGSPYEIDAIYDLIKAGLVEKVGDDND